MQIRNSLVTPHYKLMDFSVAHAGVISEAPRISEILLNVLQFLLSVVGIIAILALVITGIRYMLVQNTESASDIKKSFIAILIGLVIVMGGLIVVWTIGRFLS